MTVSNRFGRGAGLLSHRFGLALSADGLARFPEKGDHETTIFPELVAEGSLQAFRHDGLWLTVNTPKELRRADQHVTAHPEWLA